MARWSRPGEDLGASDEAAEPYRAGDPQVISSISPSRRNRPPIARASTINTIRS